MIPLEIQLPELDKITSVRWNVSVPIAEESQLTPVIQQLFVSGDAGAVPITTQFNCASCPASIHEPLSAGPQANGYVPNNCFHREQFVPDGNLELSILCIKGSDYLSQQDSDQLRKEALITLLCHSGGTIIVG